MTRPQPRTPLGDPAPKPKGKVRSVSQHVVEGELPLTVSMPDAYTGSPEIVFRWGPIHLILKDEDAVRSLAEGLHALLKVADHAYPNLEALLKEQRLERRRALQREGTEDREYTNGGLSALERAMEKAHRDAEFLAPVVDPIKAELGMPTNGGVAF